MTCGSRNSPGHSAGKDSAETGRGVPSGAAPAPMGQLGGPSERGYEVEAALNADDEESDDDD